MKKPFKVTKPEDFFREILIDRSEEQFDFEIKKIASYRTYHFRVFFVHSHPLITIKNNTLSKRKINFRYLSFYK